MIQLCDVTARTDGCCVEQYPCGRQAWLFHRHHSEGHSWGSVTFSLFPAIFSSYHWTIFEVIPLGSRKEGRWQTELSNAFSQPKGTGTGLSDSHIVQNMAQSPKLASTFGEVVGASKWQCKWLGSQNMNLIITSGVLHRQSQHFANPELYHYAVLAKPFPRLGTILGYCILIPVWVGSLNLVLSCLILTMRIRQLISANF